MFKPTDLYIPFIFLICFIPEQALAYIGPGAGLTAIGTVIALVGAILLAIVGFLWYPLKRFLSKKKEQNNNDTESS